MKRAFKGLILVVAALLVMFSTSSYASGTCAVKGCYKSAVLGGSYCRNHTCSKSGCKNFSADGSYCSEHQKKTYGNSGKSAPSSSGSSSSKTCAISGCRKSTTGGSAYCYQHKCKHAGCKNYGSENGYCSSHVKKTGSSGSNGNKGSSGSNGKNGNSSAKYCIVSGCRNARTGGSSYCTKHKCSQSGCTNKAGAGGYCDKHRSRAYDPYDVYDYNDPEDFYFDWEDDFEDYEDAEEYWDNAWN